MSANQLTHKIKQQDNRFFSTQINQVQNEQQLIHKKSLQLNQKQAHQDQLKALKNLNIQEFTNSNQKIKKQDNQNCKNQNNNQEVPLRQLLQLFNQYDKNQKGLISLEDCQSMIKSFQSQLKEEITSEEIFYFHTLSLPSNENKCTFDQLLFIFGLCEKSMLKKTPQQQIQYTRTLDKRIIDFLRLLTNYRRKCQKQSNYAQAKKSKIKVQEIRQKQFIRRKNFLNYLCSNQLNIIQQEQKQKFIMFCKSWDQFMIQYQATANQLIKKMQEKHQQEINQFIMKNGYSVDSIRGQNNINGGQIPNSQNQSYQQTFSPPSNQKIHYSKQILQFQVIQKNMVKLQQYQKAQKVKKQIQRLKHIEQIKKQKQNHQKLQTKIQNIRKTQSVSMNTLLQKIQKDRNDQTKQKTLDSQKLIVKNKNIITQFKHRHNEMIKKLYQQIHNISLDQARINNNTNRSNNYINVTGKQKMKGNTVSNYSKSMSNYGTVKK